MMGIRRIRFTLLLVLGFALLTSAPAWSLRPLVGQQAVPDFDHEQVAGGGGPDEQQGIGQDPEGKPSNGIPSKVDFELALRNLRDSLKSAWLAIWKPGILP